MKTPYATVEDVEAALLTQGYIAERPLVTAVFLCLALERPLFLEGEAGVGKTEVAKVLSNALDRPLVRLQCYEGLDRQSALYEWDYARQLLHIRLSEATRNQTDEQRNWRSQVERELFSETFLLRRPLLSAIHPDGPAPVLLIDEIDRSDEEFEAFLLEVLAEFQITIPEIGTLRATERPIIILTSNRTREVHDALKRRCLYHWLDYPSFDKEYRILRERVPELSNRLLAHVCGFVQRVRQEPMFKRPGVAETLNWAQALSALGTEQLDAARVEETIGCLVKYRDDLDLILNPKGARTSSVRAILTEIGVVS